MSKKHLFDYFNLTEPLSVKYLCHQFWHDVGDRRVDEYVIVKYGPVPIVSILSFYLLFSTIIGPRLMKNRDPLNIRGLIIFYNLSMVLFNAKFFFYSIYYLNFGVDLFKSDVLDIDREDTSEDILWQIDQANVYYYTKLADLFDTLFFVLRKKQNHVSFLHLYHHTIVPFLGWPLFRIAPTFRPFGIFAICNCLIHTIMYFYYALSALGPHMQKYLWWKKLLTQMQIFQFLIYGAYSLYCGIRFKPDYPLWMYILMYSQPIVFFTMFYRFYQQAYGKNSLKKSYNNNNNDKMVYLTNLKQFNNNNKFNNFNEKKMY